MHKAIIINQPLLDLLAARRVFHRFNAGGRWRVGERLLVHTEARLEPYGQLNAGHVLPRALGAFSYSHSAPHPALAVGRYTSIGEQVSWMGDAHPMDWATTSPVAYDRVPGPLQGVAAYLRDRRAASFATFAFDGAPAPITLGHDVWVGDQAMIRGGVTLGDGAVVGARSLVTRDVPPYAIVAGSPARVIRYRFPEPVIARLLAARWWRYGPDVVGRLDPRQIEPFLDRLEQLDEPPLDLTPLTFDEIEAAAALG